MTQQRWLGAVKNLGCVGCHQLGQLSTRTIPASLGTFASGAEAWRRRVQSGQAGEHDVRPVERAGPGFVQVLRRLDRSRRERRAAAGAPEPPAGRRAQHRRHPARLDEREAVPARSHLERSTPSRPSTATDRSSDRPSTARTSCRSSIRSRTRRRRSRLPVRDAQMPLSLGPGHAAALKPLAPSPYWGDEAIWDTRVNNHNSMLDRDGRVWLAAAVRGPDNPAFCRDGSPHPSAKLFPIDRNLRQVAVFEPKTQEIHVRRHLLRHASRAVRLRRERHAVVERRRPGARLGEHEAVPEDRRRGGVAGLDRVRAGHQRQRQARRLRRAERSGRSGEGQARRDAVLLDHAEPGRRIDLGRGDGRIPARSCASRRDRIRPRRR